MLDSFVDPAGDPTVRLGVPLLDVYLDFVAARCRPNTVLATAHDLKVFFTAVGKAPAEVTSADVLAFMTAQRRGGAVAPHRVVSFIRVVGCGTDPSSG